MDDVNCPPGMEPVDGKCVAKGERLNKEDSNAGASSGKGTDAPKDADTTLNPPATHDCPAGSSWDASTGSCEPTGDDAGNPGEGGVGNPGATGKESFYKMMEKLNSEHSQFTQTLLEKSKADQEKMFNLIAEKFGVKGGVSVESVSFGGFKTSKVGDTSVSPKAVWESTVGEPAKWFESIKKGLLSDGSGYKQWTISLENYIKNLPKQWLNYGQHTAAVQTKSEAFTISAGDMPQVFSKQVYLIPGGRMRGPIRQFLDTQIIEDSDRYNWYKVGGFDFDDVTNEGAEPTTEEAQTVTKVTATPALIRANMTVKYSDIENAPFDLIEAFNRAAGLGALDAEAKDVLDTVYDAITPTNWVGSADGAAVTGDDSLITATAHKQEGLYAGKRLIENQGGDTSPGSLVYFAHPKAVEELVLDTAADFFTGQNALHSTALGVLENRLGVDIVVTNKVATADNTTADTYRNVLMMKGVIGLAVAADLQIEAQRRPDLSAVKVGARHRLKAAIIDETMTCRISSVQ